MNKRFAPWLGLLLGIFISCSLAALFSESPWHVFKILATSFFNSKFDFGLTLFYTTCLIFSGLAFAIPMKAGLFHIGSEGQILLAALVAAYLGSSQFLSGATLPIALTFIFIFAGTLLSGVLAALILAFFKLVKKAHEVVVAIMLNFILAAMTTWLTVNYMQNPNSQNPETDLISPALRIFEKDFLKIYFENSAVSSFLIVAVVSCVVLFLVEKKTLIGYQIRAYGINPTAADRIGISARKILLLTLGLAGFFSALVGLTEVLGNTFQYKIGFSPQYGFLGIAVALLARQNFMGIIGSAFLMACLHKGASDLDMETNFLTRDFSRVLQAIIIFSVAASYFLFSRASRPAKALKEKAL